jgi:hypothetical protein
VRKLQQVKRGLNFATDLHFQRRFAMNWKPPKNSTALSLLAVLGLAGILACAGLQPASVDQAAATVHFVDDTLTAWTKWRATQVKPESDDRLAGTGYVPSPETVVYWVEPGSNKATGTTTFNAAAGNPFGTGPGGTLQIDVYRARYGVPPTPSSVFTLYAESFGLIFNAMKDACINGRLGDSSRYDCIPTYLEASDYAAQSQLGPGDPLLRPRTPRPGTECPPVVKCPDCPAPVKCPEAKPCGVLVIPPGVYATLQAAPASIIIPKGKQGPTARKWRAQLQLAADWAAGVNGKPVGP